MARVKNCVEKAEQVEIREGYDLTVSQGQEIYEAYKTDVSRMMYAAFKFGYLQGQKATTAEMKKTATSC